MVTQEALIRKAYARWSQYVMLGRWRRAERVKSLLDRLEKRSQQSMPRRLSA